MIEHEQKPQLQQIKATLVSKVHYDSGANLRRRQEVEEINSWGEPMAVAAAMAAYLISHRDPEIYVAARDKILEEFRQSTRNRKIQMIVNTRDFCQENRSLMSPGVAVSSLALATRRLDLLSKMIKAGFAEGDAAVRAVDYILGQTEPLSSETNSLYAEWSESDNLLRLKDKAERVGGGVEIVAMYWVPRSRFKNTR